MTGAQLRPDRQRGAGRLPAAGLVWLLTVLSILQWIAPSVDPSLRAQFNGHATSDRVLATADHLSLAAEAKSPARPVASEKRSGGQRSLPSSEDSDAVLQIASSAKSDGTTGPILAEVVVAVSRHGHSFTARGPPGIG